MALFVLVSDNCWQDARTHGLVDDVENLRNRVELAQSTSLFDPFPPGYLVKKKFGSRQGRLIAGRWSVGEHAVVVLLSILIRGDRAYAEFARDPNAYGKQHLTNLVAQHVVEQFVADRTRESPPREKGQVREAEYGFLYGAFEHHQDPKTDDLVCETKEWVEQIAQERFSKQLPLLYRPCLDALTKPNGLHQLPLVEKAGWSVWVLRAEGRLVLLVPASEGTAGEAKRAAKALAQRLEGKGPEAILRSSQRVYPAVILADDELWADLERESVANMALSPEESEVLESARGPQLPFPLFINGRAGSGKSTVLQYLFADLLYFYLNMPEPRTVAPPIYLTASSELLRVARGFVERLLRSEAAFAQLGSTNLGDRDREILNSAFQEFQQHLLSLLTVEERAERFPRPAYVDYPRFRRMWLERFGKEKRALRDFGPDLSWHVVRSYIKGMSSETFLEPEDYLQLPDNQITVTAEAFAAVHERIWVNWYQEELEGKGFWDDQDLTRYVIENGLVKPIHPAVFCDEAQDFTRLELELLLRLSLFSDRTLTPNDVSRVPFAFAGDQFQTLNPTGFRWESIKASFVEKFLLELDPARQTGRTDLNYRELHFNYRSTHRIVRFSNHVQALRAALFQLPDLKPQTAWAVEQSSMPVVWFRANDAAFWANFKDDAGFVVIVPCSEGEEHDFVANDPVLREHIKIEDGLPHNVLSAGRAKGCEYPAVMVYGFGASCETDVVSSLAQGEPSEGPSPDASLPLQYFINRLYVAVSRAKRRLIVVDTEEGFQKLWKCALDEAQESKMLAKVKHGESLWAVEVEGMTPGNPEDVTRETAVSPLENAEVFELDGLARKDAFLLRQAAQAYRAGGNLPKSRECRARALEAEGNFYEAGSAFFEAGWSREGVRCLWRAGRPGWARLVEFAREHPEIEGELEVQFAGAATERQAPSDTVRLVGRFARRLGDDRIFAEECQGDSSWPEALDAVLLVVVGGETLSLDERARTELFASLQHLPQRRFHFSEKVLPWVHYAQGRYAQAVVLWEGAGKTQSPQYWRAKAETEPYPKRVIWLEKLGETAEILEASDKARGVPVETEEARIIASALRKEGRLSESLGLLWRAGSADLMLDLALHAIRTGDSAVGSAALRAGILLLVKRGSWKDVLCLATSGEFAPDKHWKDRAVRDRVRLDRDDLRITIVRAIARVSEISKDNGELAAGFLRTFLRVKDCTWKSRLSMQEAGAAIECVGRPSDAVAFYEACLKEDPVVGERSYLQTRLLVSKVRQLEAEGSAGHADKAKQIKADVKSLRKILGLPANDRLPSLPRLPELEPIGPGANLAAASQEKSPQNPKPVAPTSTVEPAGESSLLVGPFRIEVLPRHGRCNITHNETKETAYVKVATKECGGEAEFVQIDATHWRGERWGLQVEFLAGPTDGIKVTAPAFGVEVLIRMESEAVGAA